MPHFLTVLCLNSEYKLLNVLSVDVPSNFDFSCTAVYVERILQVSTDNTVGYLAV